MNEQSRLPNVIRGYSPCMGCKERFLAFSDHCPKDERGEYGYKAWKNEIQEIEERRKAYKAMMWRKHDRF